MANDHLWQARRGLCSVGLILTLDPDSRNYSIQSGGSGKCSSPVGLTVQLVVEKNTPKSGCEVDQAKPRCATTCQ